MCYKSKVEKKEVAAAAGILQLRGVDGGEGV